jgi:hypothetical protein
MLQTSGGSAPSSNVIVKEIAEITAIDPDALVRIQDVDLFSTAKRRLGRLIAK